MTEQTPLPPNDISVVGVVAGLLRDMENRLIARMDDNSRIASERWARHDAEAERSQRQMREWVTRLETTLADHIIVANAHFTREHDEDLVLEARVRPIKTVGLLLVRNWRTILLLVLGILAVLGFAEQTLENLLR